MLEIRWMPTMAITYSAVAVFFDKPSLAFCYRVVHQACQDLLF